MRRFHSLVRDRGVIASSLLSDSEQHALELSRRRKAFFHSAMQANPSELLRRIPASFNFAGVRILAAMDESAAKGVEICQLLRDAGPLTSRFRQVVSTVQTEPIAE